MKREIIYYLCDDNGFNSINLEFLISVNTVFEHEYGTYKVDEIIEKHDGVFVNCERITTYSKLRNLNN